MKTRIALALSILLGFSISASVVSAGQTPATLTCPMTIGISSDGTLFFDRFNGWYKTTPKTLEEVLHAGCYSDANPRPISSLKLALAANAPKTKIDLIMSVLKRQGWSKEKVKIRDWKGYPKRPNRED